MISIIVSGWPGSGKTAASQIIAEFGYAYVSASGVLADLAGDPQLKPPSRRRVLQEFGKKFLEENDATSFAQTLLSRSGGKKRIVIDGVRPTPVVHAIRKMTVRSRVLFIECPFTIRLKRLRLSREEYNRMVNHPVEQAVVDVQKIADAAITNNGSKAELRENLESALNGGP